VVEDPSEWMSQQRPFTYLPCLSHNVSGCVDVLVNIGHRLVECVRVRIPLEESGPGPRTVRVTYELDGESCSMGGWKRREGAVVRAEALADMPVSTQRVHSPDSTAQLLWQS
jgi:hypothetical protein